MLNMIIDRIREKIRGDFKPFTLCLSDGRSYLIPNPEYIAVGVSIIVVITQDDRVLTIDPQHIISLEEEPGRKIR